MRLFNCLILSAQCTTFTPVQGIAKNAFEGELRCRKLGGHLAFFRDEAEFKDFNEATGHGSSNHWIGVQRIGSSSTWMNVDGTTPWLNWDNGEPNNSGGEERCVELYIQPGDEPAVMNDKFCSASRLYSCRIDDPPTCADIEPNCNASNCDSGFAKLFCPKTCGRCDTWTPQSIGDIGFLDNWTAETCVDKNSQCEGWANSNQCMVNPAYMLKNCPVSCKQCAPACAGFLELPDDITMSFFRAKRTCAALGGSLAYFNSEEEYNVFKAGRTFERDDWLGIQRKSRVFKTVARTELGWTNWKNGEPSMDMTTRACVKAGYTGQWNDEDCDTKFQVTCRFEDSSYCKLY